MNINTLIKNNPDKFNDLIKIINDKINSLNEATESPEIELFGKVVSVFSKFVSVGRYIQKKNFIHFLKGLCFEDIEGKNLARLNHYISNKNTSDYLLNFINEFLHSKSERALMVAGLYTSKILKNDEELGFESMNIFNFLLEVFDNDIDNLLIIDKKFEGIESGSIGYVDFSDEKVSFDEIESLLNKCVAYSIIGKNLSSNTAIEIEKYSPIHPLESGYRSSYPVEIEEYFYRKNIYETLIKHVKKINS